MPWHVSPPRHFNVVSLPQIWRQTANVDYETDRFIQQTLRTSPRLAQRTLIVIAHRLDTVADADIILWLDNGRLLACGTPSVILPRVRADDADKVLEDDDSGLAGPAAGIPRLPTLPSSAASEARTSVRTIVV